MTVSHSQMRRPGRTAEPGSGKAGVAGVFTTSYIPPNARAIFRSSAIGAAITAVLSLIIFIPLGLGLAAAFGVFGLALGVANSWMVQRAAARFADQEGAGKGKLAVTALGRLAISTVIALACALLFRPDGVGVVAGLAAFQLIAVAAAAAPMIRELRHQ